ncbi:MAG: hypothetical protein ABI220_01850 [Candidatus Saccharimonadales bacterium]
MNGHPLRTSRNKSLLSIILAVVIILALFFTLGGVSKIKKIYYGHKSRSALSSESKKLGDPLKSLGFTDIKGSNSLCQYTHKANYSGKMLGCITELKSYTVFPNKTSKDSAILAASKLSAALEKDGWHRGNYEVGEWFKDVLNGVDYNPDAYQYKYSGNTFCVLDYFVAYSNPKPPAVSVTFSCTTPEIHPPAY